MAIWRAVEVVQLQNYVVIIQFTGRVYRKSVLSVLFSFVYFFNKYTFVEIVLYKINRSSMKV